MTLLSTVLNILQHPQLHSTYSQVAVLSPVVPLLPQVPISPKNEQKLQPLRVPQAVILMSLQRVQVEALM